MKHSVRLTIWLVTIFLLAQLIGLGVLTQYIDIKTTAETRTTVLINESYDITGLAPPVVQNENFSFLYILIAVVVGTVLVLLIVRFRKKNLWKLWFFLSVVLTLMIAFAPFFMKFFLRYLPVLSKYVLIITFIIATVLAYYKVFRRNMYIHNFTELFIYGGLASLLVPILNVVSAVVLLVLISFYDMYAVWKSKHMVKMAEFQSESKVFAGLMIPYGKDDYKKIGEKPVVVKSSPKPTKSVKLKPTKGKQIKTTDAPRNAILGGGDVAFPLLFSGAVLKFTGNFWIPIMISIFAGLALLVLFLISKKGRYYPAMPFVTIGCFAGYGVGWLLF